MLYIDICKLTPSVGDCQASVTRYFFDSSLGRCKPFTYSGCGGNKNRFESFRDCIKQCGKL